MIYRPAIRLIKWQHATFLQSGWNLGTGVFKKSFPPGSTIIKAAKCAATIEGLICGSISFLVHLQSRKHINKFDANDWREISRDTLIGVARGAYRGGAIFAISEHVTLSFPAAGMLVSAAMSIAETAAEYSEGLIPGRVCIGRLAVGCLASIVYFVFAKAGERIISLPVVGSIVGGAIGIAACLLMKESVKNKVLQQTKNR